ncbi:hypothetical protein A5779_04845 [Mycolicibacterium peregrinum]|uniref:Uncharacterized protein n=2 Tax=Mycolicibacterium peregrinum TaxID=43304 RepID=A0A1A0VNM8_MYCPR|nr:hypothetical protein A5779_04845 [Mycolicibacterium peregrinum]
MRPWLEGKALYAQYDAFPGRSEVLSLRSQNIFGYFIPRKSMVWNGKTLHDMVDPVSRFLVEQRTAQCAVDLKSDLLVSATGLEDGGYLTGYLACKRFVSLCQTASSVAKDSDFAIDYLHHYLLNDWHFAELLLKESPDPETAVEVVADYVIARLNLIESSKFRRIIDNELHAYEEATSGPLKTGDEILAPSGRAIGSFFSNADTCLAAFDYFQDWLEWAHMRGGVTGALLNPRSFFRLGSVGGTLSIDELGVLNIDCADAIGTWKIGAKTDLGQCESVEAEMHLMLMPTMSIQLISFTADGRCIWADLPKSLRGTQVERTVRDMIFATASQQQKIRERRSVLASAMVDSGKFLNDVVAEHRARVMQSFNSFSTRHVLRPGHQLSKEADRKLQKSGLWDLVGRDPVAVRTLAFLGVLGSCSDDATRKPQVREDVRHDLAARFGADLRIDYLNEIENRAKLSGFTVLKKWRDQYWSIV